MKHPYISEGCDQQGRQDAGFVDPWLEGHDHGWVIPYALMLCFFVFVVGVVAGWW